MEKHRKKLIKNATVFDGHSSGLAQGKKIVIEDGIFRDLLRPISITIWVIRL